MKKFKAETADKYLDWFPELSPFFAHFEVFKISVVVKMQSSSQQAEFSYESEKEKTGDF